MISIIAPLVALGGLIIIASYIFCKCNRKLFNSDHSKKSQVSKDSEIGIKGNKATKGHANKPFQIDSTEHTIVEMLELEQNTNLIDKKQITFSTPKNLCIGDDKSSTLKRSRRML